LKLSKNFLSTRKICSEFNQKIITDYTVSVILYYNCALTAFISVPTVKNLNHI